MISITDLTTDSPALPLQQEPSKVVTTAPSLEQDNLALINVSAENTPKETKKEVVVTSKPKPSNIVTSWADEENDTSKQQNNGHLRPTRSKNTASDRIVATHSNRRSTRRSVASTTRRSVDTMAAKRMPSVASVR
ncbi:uncharacterized protein [Amphiura filiformis]|uniref:uncharacterized protein n=1 Tax=Amphiura filiformis TaxID=82378 RepID=UPI003B220136